MPCTYTGSLEGDRIMSLEEGLGKASTALTATTQAACEMAKLLTPAQFAKLSSNTKKWIEDHKKVDAKRKGK